MILGFEREVQLVVHLEAFLLASREDLFGEGVGLLGAENPPDFSARDSPVDSELGAFASGNVKIGGMTASHFVEEGKEHEGYQLLSAIGTSRTVCECGQSLGVAPPKLISRPTGGPQQAQVREYLLAVR
ncbi:MAG: hypothetical protein GEU90_15185 [Gemmatimonas sp.]|nr:hypothetical protein [Gemmatimonas sp.]